METEQAHTRPVKLITLERKKGILPNLTGFLIKVPITTDVQIFKIFESRDSKVIHIQIILCLKVGYKS